PDMHATLIAGRIRRSLALDQRLQVLGPALPLPRFSLRNRPALHDCSFARSASMASNLSDGQNQRSDFVMCPIAMTLPPHPSPRRTRTDLPGRSDHFSTSAARRIETIHSAAMFGPLWFPAAVSGVPPSTNPPNPCVPDS